MMITTLRGTTQNIAFCNDQLTNTFHGFCQAVLQIIASVGSSQTLKHNRDCFPSEVHTICLTPGYFRICGGSRWLTDKQNVTYDSGPNLYSIIVSKAHFFTAEFSSQPHVFIHLCADAAAERVHSLHWGLEVLLEGTAAAVMREGRRCSGSSCWANTKMPFQSFRAVTLNRWKSTAGMWTVWGWLRMVVWLEIMISSRHWKSLF